MSHRLFCLAILAACSNAADPPATDAPAQSDAMPDASTTPLETLRINEVVASGAPDWFEIVNVSATPVELADYCYVDSSPLSACKAFPAMQLAANARFVQDVDDTLAGFKLVGDEELHVHRITDMRVSDETALHQEKVTADVSTMVEVT